MYKEKLAIISFPRVSNTNCLPNTRVSNTGLYASTSLSMLTQRLRVMYMSTVQYMPLHTFLSHILMQNGIILVPVSFNFVFHLTKLHKHIPSNIYETDHDTSLRLSFLFYSVDIIKHPSRLFMKVDNRNKGAGTKIQVVCA